MPAHRTQFYLLVLLATVALVGACSDEPTTPGVQPEIVNSADHFSYQVTNIQNYSATLSYPWQNSGTQATVNQACTVSSGSATLVILDAMALQVYSRSLADNGTFVSASGTPGAWTIRVVYSSASATVNFRADKTT